MKRSRIPFARAAVLLPLLVAACGGGGGGGGIIPDGFEATFTGAASGGDPGDISMAAGADSGANFDVDVKIQGPLQNFFGVAFRIQVPANVDLTGSGGNGSILLGPNSEIFNASQAQVGDEVLVTATRVQPAGGGFDSGVDVPAGTSHVMTLNFKATGATSGNMSPSNTELRTCDDGTETCSALPGATFSGGTLVAN